MKIEYQYVENTTICPKCGVVVMSELVHTRFHEELIQVKDFMDRYRSKQ